MCRFSHHGYTHIEYLEGEGSWGEKGIHYFTLSSRCIMLPFPLPLSPSLPLPCPYPSTHPDIGLAKVEWKRAQRQRALSVQEEDHCCGFCCCHRRQRERALSMEMHSVGGVCASQLVAALTAAAYLYTLLLSLLFTYIHTHSCWRRWPKVDWVRLAHFVVRTHPHHLASSPPSLPRRP